MFSKLSLSAKLIGGFVVVAIFTCAVGVIGYWGVSHLTSQILEIGEVRLPSVDSLRVIETQLNAIRTAQRTLLNPRLNEQDRKRQFDNLAKAREEYKKAWDIYEPLPHTQLESQLWKEFVPAVNAWREENELYEKYVEELGATDIYNPVALERELQRFRGDHYALMENVLKLLVFGTEFEGGHDPTACNFGKWMASFQTKNPELQRALAEIRAHHNVFHETVAAIRDAMKNGDKEAATKRFLDVMEPAAEKTFHEFDLMLAEAEKASTIYDKMIDQTMVKTREKQVVALDLLDKVIAENERAAEEARTDAQQGARVAKVLSVSGLLIGTLLALLFGILLASSISKSLNRVILALSQGSDQVNAAASQVAQSSQAMAAGASEQASSLEETSASLEEMASMTRQNADNTNQVNALMQEAKQSVDLGMARMQEMSAAITDIRKSADDMARIVKTIDEVAFQTNLLALNAAVEAARAGDAGKGFAVVAEEVRNLAQRSAEAAKNTAQLIENAQRQAEGGVQVTGQLEEAFRQIAENASKVAALVAEVNAASNEQAQGIDQINTAVAQMDKVTQANAANSEEAASASEELSAQARELNDMVQVLMQIVGGKAAARASNAGGGELRRPTLSHKPAATKTKALAPKAASAPRKVVEPEQVIPLDDDDLKEF